MRPRKLLRRRPLLKFGFLLSFIFPFVFEEYCLRALPPLLAHGAIEKKRPKPTGVLRRLYWKWSQGKSADLFIVFSSPNFAKTTTHRADLKAFEAPRRTANNASSAAQGRKRGLTGEPKPGRSNAPHGAAHGAANYSVSKVARKANTFRPAESEPRRRVGCPGRHDQGGLTGLGCRDGRVLVPHAELLGCM